MDGIIVKMNCYNPNRIYVIYFSKIKQKKLDFKNNIQTNLSV